MLNKNQTYADQWIDLKDHKKSWSDIHMKDLFANDPNRFDKFHIKCGDVLFDYSKHLISEKTIQLLTRLASASGVEEKRQDMLSGKQLNHTEKRAVLHMALREDIDQTVSINGENINQFIEALHQQIQIISEKIRADKTIKNVIHIGVGGSDLGPNLVCQAFSHLHNGPKMHFINNIDGQTISELLSSLNANETAILIASKTFTTLETCTNANFAKEWMRKSMTEQQFAQRCFAMTSCIDKATEFGILAGHILPMRDWIGGRFSLWSSIGLPIAIALGYDQFQNLLNGAKLADEHFKNQPLDQNIPVLMAMLGIWYRNIFDYHGHAILPYNDNLGLLPTYMQQLDMESNGKHSPDYKTAPIVFGGSGTCAQHAFMQALHQSTEITPCDFIVIANNSNSPDHFQNALNANALAQSQALMLGRDGKDEPHSHFPGNRPSSTFLLSSLTPKTLGTLLALYEHKIFIQGIIWKINSFDQWGVELGKTLAKDIIANLSQSSCLESHDSSTKGLIHAILEEYKNT